MWQNSEVRNLHKWKGCLQVLWLITNDMTSSIPLLYSINYSTGKINRTLIKCNMILIKELILLWLSGFQCRRIVKWICIQKQWLCSFQVWIPCSLRAPSLSHIAPHPYKIASISYILYKLTIQVLRTFSGSFIHQLNPEIKFNLSHSCNT
jgi:hypothetical protein